MMTKTLLLLAAIFVAAPVPQEKSLQKIPDQTWERETRIDADGLMQFVEYDVKCEVCRGTGTWNCLRCERWQDKNETCLECNKTKKATCRTCAGNKKLHDPLEAMICVFCSPYYEEASGLVDCVLCGGGGKIIVTDKDGNSNSSKCGSCKGEGRFACAVCEGTRVIESVKVKKKSPGIAKLKDIMKVHEGLTTILAEVEAFEPIARSSKNDKALEAIFKKHGKSFPPLKGMMEMLETVAGGLDKAGAGFANYEPNLIHVYSLYRNKTIFMLRHQIMVLDAHIKRTTHNDAVEEQSLQATGSDD
tara:strand:- start:1045 stop:1953 length:909 start_codon:yes stop_codon:yes gene_type:complete